MRLNKFFIYMIAFLLSGLLSGMADAADNSLKQDGIGGTGAAVMRDGIGGTGAPARNGIGGTGAPLMNGGIGGTGLLPGDTSAGLASLAGRVLFVTGAVAVQDTDQTRMLAKGDLVHEGDTLNSGKDALLQLRMEDGGIIVLRSESQLKIVSYAYNGIEDGSEHISLVLLTGGFRAITGSIGHLHKELYSIRTPNASIGIRGTDHETVYVPQPAAGQQASVAPGTYNHVISGATLLQDEHGELLIKPNQTGFAPLQGAAPLLINQTLPIFGEQKSDAVKKSEQNSAINSSANDKKETSTANNQVSGGEQTSHSSSESTGNPIPGTQQNNVTQTEHLGNSNLNLDTPENDSSSSSSSSSSGSAVVGSHLSEGLLAVGSVRAGNPGATIQAGGGSLSGYANNVSGFNFSASEADQIERGSVQVDGSTVSWGIYADGTAFNTSGKAITINAHAYAYAYGGAAPPAVLGTGTASFSTLAHTTPVSESGNPGGSVTLNVSVNLGTSTLTGYNLNVTDASSRNWNAQLINGTPVALSSFANGTPLSVNCNSCTGSATGNAAGLLIGSNAKGMISSYALGTTTGQAVTGAVILSRP